MHLDPRFAVADLPADAVDRASRAVAVWKGVAIACVPVGLAAWVWIGLLTTGSVLALVAGIIAAVVAAQMWVKARRRLDVAIGEMFQGLADDAPLQLGECFDSCRVTVNDADMVYLVAGRAKVRGLIRVCAAAASVAFGVHLLSTTLSVGLIGARPLILTALALAVVPVVLALPFTVSWGVLQTANGASELLIQQVWLFFMPRIEAIGRDQIAHIQIERIAFKGGESAQLFVAERSGRKRCLASAMPGTVAERRLSALRVEILRVVG